MLPESRLYSFIDQKEGFTLHFLEGQKIVQDIAISHKLTGPGFNFFRDILLSTQMLLAFLKAGEGLGIYLDSDEPYFKFNIEMNDFGQMRTLLLPENLNIFPDKIKGRCRLSKTSPSEKIPYNSIIDLTDTALTDIINKLLRDSYQLPSQIFLSDVSDQVIMISKLPSVNIDKVQTNYRLTVEEYWLKNKSDFENIFNNFLTSTSEIHQFFENKNLLLLSSREVQFRCNCSRDRMSQGLWSLIKSAGINHIFMEDENEIETKCDYCNKNYSFKRNEFLS
jgi:molecular chaperone Hsp33